MLTRCRCRRYDPIGTTPGRTSRGIGAAAQRPVTRQSPTGRPDSSRCRSRCAAHVPTGCDRHEHARLSSLRRRSGSARGTLTNRAPRRRRWYRASTACDFAGSRATVVRRALREPCALQTDERRDRGPCNRPESSPGDDSRRRTYMEGSTHGTRWHATKSCQGVDCQRPQEPPYIDELDIPAASRVGSLAAGSAVTVADVVAAARSPGPDPEPVKGFETRAGLLALDVGFV